MAVLTYLLVWAFRVRKGAPAETGLMERALGVLGIVWGVSSLGVVGNYAYVICTAPLLLLSLPQILSAYKPQIAHRMTLAGLCALVWGAIAFEVLIHQPLTLDTMRGVAFYGWAIWVAGYSYAHLAGRQAAERREIQEQQIGIIHLRRAKGAKEGIK